MVTASRKIAGLTVVALTAILALAFLWKSSESNTLPAAGLEPPTQVTDSELAEAIETTEVGDSIAYRESGVRYSNEEVDELAIAEWRRSLGYLESELNTESIAAAYQAYDNDTLESLSGQGDAYAQLLLAERYSVFEDRQERIQELYLDAAIAGKTAGLTALGTYGFTDKVFGKNDLVRVSDNGQLTDEYEGYLAYFLAAELQRDPVGAALFDFNVHDEHQALVSARIDALCEKGSSIIEEIEQARRIRGISVKPPEPPPGLLDHASLNWHCSQD